MNVFAALAFVPCALAFLNIKDERTRYSVAVSAAVSALGFLGTVALIPLVRRRTLRAGLSGKDINKRGSEAGEKDIPEALGLAPGVVFLVSDTFRAATGSAHLTLLRSPPAGVHHSVPAAALL